jgi:branched-chain amino acid transport system ATP-binding protein
MALLEVDRVAAGYVEGIDILAGIGLRVEAGSVTGIIGPNGAGKSTLLKTIFGFLHPREGRIVHDGREIQRAAPGWSAATAGA